MLCTNTSGSFRVPPLYIGTAQKPRCIKVDTNLPCEYRGTKKAWMTSEVFLDRFLLFLDDSRTHLSAEELNKIDEKCFVVFLPPNCTSLIQPMDMGVISAPKRRYRTAFLQELLISECKDKNEVEKGEGR
ncbi:tigger transposable element-derived protein 6-like [Belonocnema kinseyi]|uniref:tigger transposable element-derived protein 6-like n=1 Tax=Belonocnema kinseyi TaxID=2817044 RepID=UPI00143D5C38|nr:tigger transposable element-derived protein 6-like [Belonocnema kinseyi]